MHKIISALFALSLLQTGCQYPVDSSALPDSKKYMVIDVELTEKYGKLNVDYSLSKADAQGSYSFGSNPKVGYAYITDSQGRRTDFNQNGILDTTFRAVVGETYTLFVEADGLRYQSKPETMRPCPEIDSVAILYSRESYRSPSDLYYDGFDAYIYLQDTPGEQNYYQWDWIHYERALSCDKKYDQRARRNVLIPCNPINCWNIFENRNVIVQSDQLRDGNIIAKKIVRVPFIKPPLKYYLRIEQRSVTPTVYAYLQSLETQTQSTGTRYDIPAQTRFSPNIFNADNPGEQVLGIFNVYSSRRKIVYVNREQIINGVVARIIEDNTPFSSDPFVVPAPCVEGAYRTSKKPEGWVD